MMEADIQTPKGEVADLKERGSTAGPEGNRHRRDFLMPPRDPLAHKGIFGRIFILAGSVGYTGAPVMAARAALRTGAGLVFVGVPKDIYPIVAVKCEEAMPFPLPEEPGEILERARGCDVALVGPGLGREKSVQKLVHLLLRELEIPVVLDADGINALSGHIDILDQRSAPTILTPHSMEFSRLTGCQLPIQDPLKLARDFAERHSCTMVLKGHRTITAAPDGAVWVNDTGNPGMAKGGSGDVLAGMIAALLGQKHLGETGASPAKLVAMAVWYHGLAGDRCAEKFGEYAMLPTDLIEMLPEVLKDASQTH